MTDSDGSQHDLEEVFGTRLESRHFGADGGGERPIDGALLLDPEDIDPEDLLERLLMGFDDFIGHFQKVGNGGVGGRKEVVVDCRSLPRISRSCAEVICLDQGHVAALGAVGDGGLGVVETRNPVARDSTEEPAVVMVLATEPAVLVQLFWKVNLVAGATEFCLGV